MEGLGRQDAAASGCSDPTCSLLYRVHHLVSQESLIRMRASGKMEIRSPGVCQRAQRARTRRLVDDPYSVHRVGREMACDHIPRALPAQPSGLQRQPLSTYIGAFITRLSHLFLQLFYADP